MWPRLCSHGGLAGRPCHVASPANHGERCWNPAWKLSAWEGFILGLEADGPRTGGALCAQPHRQAERPPRSPPLSRCRVTRTASPGVSPGRSRWESRWLGGPRGTTASPISLLSNVTLVSGRSRIKEKKTETKICWEKNLPATSVFKLESTHLNYKCF